LDTNNYANKIEKTESKFVDIVVDRITFLKKMALEVDFGIDVFNKPNLTCQGRSFINTSRGPGASTNQDF
jgi:hypothetical protein